MSNMVDTLERARLWPFGKQLAPGHACGRMLDRMAVRNPQSSIHAGVLCTLAETTGNFALISSTPENGSWIVTGMDIDYRKKARGEMFAQNRLGTMVWLCGTDLRAQSRVTDQQGDVVAVVETDGAGAACALRPQFLVGHARFVSRSLAPRP